MLDQEFIRSASVLDGRFGTENVGPLLYSMVKFCRPRNVLEVGAGYSTLFILKALAENTEEDRMERNGEKKIYNKTGYYDQPYEPILLTLDDYSHLDSSRTEITGLIERLGLDKYLLLKKTDFRGYSRRLNSDFLPLDFIWFDCGGIEEYIDFTNEYWPLTNSDGGIIMFHSTLTNVYLNLFIQKIEALKRDPDRESFEILNLLEPHKTAQNSVSIIRKTEKFKSPIYTIYP